MENNELNCYLNGLFDTASSVSVWMGPSYVKAYLFDNNSFEKELKESFKLNAGVFIYSGLSFGDLIYQLFGYENETDKRVSQSLIYHIKKELGEPEFTDVIDDEYMEILEKRNSPFPFTYVEEAAVVRFEKYTLLLVTGNNE
ncbi:MAG: hypothetical protein IJT49_08080 [Clostridia bacterium]|nr:hypothetical protein [Clostridia bacterium]